jgi:hypothetical protein
MARGRHIEGLKIGEQPVRPVLVRLFVCTNHDGEHGSGSQRASVIVARDEVHARELLDRALLKLKLLPYARSRYKLEEIPLDHWRAEILADGSL